MDYYQYHYHLERRSSAEKKSSYNNQQSKNGSKANSYGEPDQIVLLAKNNQGYSNILSLVSKYHLDPDGGLDPRISIDDLDKHQSGIIALTGGCKGGIGKLLANDQYENAEKLLLRLGKIFSENLYLEIQRHHLPLEDKIEGMIRELSEETGAKDIKKEILTNFEFKKDDIFEKLKIVTREEFEILKLTIQKQDKEIKNLTKKLKLKR